MSLLYTMHHIVSDGWSEGVLNREIKLLYEAFSHGQPSLLPELPIQYADYAVWQREWLQGDVLREQLNYWKKQLEGCPVLELPTDRPRPVMQTFNGAMQELRLGSEIASGLRELSQREGVTLFMTLLAGFQTLLSRYCAQEDIAVGSVIANRHRTEVEKLIGFFVNTLVLRTDLSGDPTVVELLRRVKEVSLGAYGHQDLPFEKLVEELQPERDLSRNPLVQVVFLLHNEPDEGLELKGMELRPLAGLEITTRFDLEVHFSERKWGASGSIIYNTDLFENETIKQMAGHLERVLESFAKNPTRRLSELELLSEGEREEILFGLNNTKTEYPKGKCLHELFENQVERSPEAMAVTHEGQRLTYRELNERSNRLAHYLKRMGLGSEVLVGLYMERSLEMIVGLLGIVKAGGAYLPLDTNYPRERVEYILADGKAPVLLTEKRFLASLQGYAGKIVCLDRDAEKIDQERKDNSATAVRADNAAYVIYTSGSTGQPKGVVVTHCNVIRLFQATQPWFGFGAQDVWTFFHSNAFDFSVWEIWGGLLYGGKVVVVPVLGEPSAGGFLPVADKRGCHRIKSNSLCLSAIDEGGRNVGRKTGLAASICDFRRRSTGDEKFEAMVRSAWRPVSKDGEHVWDHRDHGACNLSSDWPRRFG